MQRMILRALPASQALMPCLRAALLLAVGACRLTGGALPPPAAVPADGKRAFDHWARADPLADSNTTACSAANITVGARCAGAPIAEFACNMTAPCCAACANDTRCSTWTLGAAANTSSWSTCALFANCSLISGGQGNCSRGRLRPPTPLPGPPKPPPGGLSFRFVGTWRGVHPKSLRAGNGTSQLPDEVVGECTCSLITPFWIITAEHCAERVLKHEKTKVHINFHGQKPHVERRVNHCISASHRDVDIAICHLTVAVHAFPPLAINPTIMKTVRVCISPRRPSHTLPDTARHPAA